MNDHVLILLAPGFEEGDIIYCLDRLRAAGVTVSLVAISLGLIKSAHGLSIRPDYTLGQLPAGASYRLIIVPGGRQSTAVLLTDPRIHRLFNAVCDNGGTVVAMTSAASTLAEAGVDGNLGPDKFIVQRDEDIVAFSDQLLDLCLA